MLIKTYLHDQIADTIQLFGTIDDVANKIIDAGMAGVFDIENLPACPKGNAAKKFYIDITNEDFLEMREQRGSRSNAVSIRRILYWFVDNEAWDILNMPFRSQNYVSSGKLKYITRATTIATELYKLYNEMPAKHKPKTLKLISIMKEVLNDIRT